jgi:2-dehydropantoate 2-reductase
MRVLIIGAGAIGSVVGGFLQQAGHQVELLGRAAHLEAIRVQGLRIYGIWGEHTIHGMGLHTIPDSIPRASYDAVIVCVKSYATAEAAQVAAHFAGRDTLVVAYQNGLGNAEQIAEVVGWDRTVGVRAIYGVRIDTPGCAEVTVIAAPTAIGMYRPAEASPAREAQVLQLVSAMDAAGLPTVAVEHVSTVLWAKVAYNAALNPLSALLNVPYGALPKSPDTRAIMEQVIDELYAVATAMGVGLAPATADAYKGHFYRDLVPPTAAHYASMREDLRQGRRTEIDALNGAVAAFGRQHDVFCPTNELLTRVIHGHEALRGGLS